jgi:hypothetical protein
MNPDPLDEFHIVLKPVKGWPRPAIRQLAIILKRLGRNYGFKCISARAVTPQPKDKP